MPASLCLRRLSRVAAAFLISALWSLHAMAGQTDIKAPSGSGRFGSKTVPLPNGNLVIVDSGFQSNTGAVYLYSPAGAMISRLTGSGIQDSTGTGNIQILVLTNGHYVVRSPGWDNGGVKDAGAVTWCSGVTGLNGEISAENSLVGTRKEDLRIESGQGTAGGMVALDNGNYVICSPYWDNDDMVDTGAVTWGDGNGGTVGVISSENSLTGSTAGDFVGTMAFNSGVTPLANGDYVVSCPIWDNGPAKEAGFAAWCSGVRGRSGVVSAEIALVGIFENDRVGGGMNTGRGVTALTNGNYVVCSPLWDNGGVKDAGAVTWCPGEGGLAGSVTVENSLIGSSASDRVGRAGMITFSTGVTALSDGHYVVTSSEWDNGGMTDAGAVTWGNGFTGSTGVVSAENSLTGTRSAMIGNGGVFALMDGDYVVCTPSWAGDGAVTWVKGGQFFSGVVSRGNSLTGSRGNDHVGNGGITVLSSGNYVISSPDWANGELKRAGAVTWCRGGVPLKGVVSPENSLTGSAGGDRVGSGEYSVKGVTALSNGNYVVSSPYWSREGVAAAGAVTWCPGTAGLNGPVTTANSLTGSTPGDQVGGGAFEQRYGGVTALANGNYVVCSLRWSSGAVASVGAVTWGDGFVGTTGTITSGNSLTGVKAMDCIGSGGVAALGGGNYTVLSPDWDNPATGAVNAGAATLGDGKTGTVGLINPANSVSGTVANRGSDLSCTGNPTGTVLVVGQPGAGLLSFLTFGALGLPAIHVELPNGKRITGIDFGTMAPGSVKAMQFVIKNPSHAPLRLESVILNHPAFVLNTVPAGPVAPGHGAMLTVSFSPPASGPQSALLRIIGMDGAVGSPCEITLKGTGTAGWPAIVRDLTGPAGSGSFGHSVTVLPNGNFVVTDPWFDLPGPVRDAGAVYLYGSEGALLSSLTGSAAGDRVGIGEVKVLKNGNYVIVSPFWKSGSMRNAGAVTWADGNTGINGTVSPDNSLVGSSLEDLVGGTLSDERFTVLNTLMPGGVTALENGNYVVCSPRWNNGTGAVTWCDGVVGARGVVTAERSLTAGAGQRTGGGGVVALKNGNYVVISPGWRDSQDILHSGAVTWGSGVTGISGMISEANSLVGGAHRENESVGGLASGGVTALADGHYIICSPLWKNGPDRESAGAVTSANGEVGVTGRISPANSLTGTAAGDLVGNSPPVILKNGNYVIASPVWDGNGVVDAGAVTLCHGSMPTTGPVSGMNSLTGVTDGDSIGSGGVTALSNGNYVVRSPRWHGGSPESDGAVTWGHGATGVAGPVTAINSLTGTGADSMGGGVTALTDGNYVVRTASWNNNDVVSAGAVTWGNGNGGLRGRVSRENSLTGSRQRENLGSGGVAALPEGAFVVCSPYWEYGRGAVTRCGPGGRPGEIISTGNSLTGSNYNDHAGSGGVTVLDNGHYVVVSPGWRSGTPGFPGAATWCEGPVGRTGEISETNSLTGVAFESHVHGGVTALGNGNYLVDSPAWRSFSGAMTWGDGLHGVAGRISAENSLTGSRFATKDAKRIVTFGAAHYAVFCPSWPGMGFPGEFAGGAVILGTGDRAFSGMINGTNSVLGAVPEGGDVMNAAFRASDRTFMVGRPADNMVTLFRYRSDTGREVTVRQPGGERISAGGLCGFGVVPVGESASMVLTVENTGATSLSLDRVEVGGPPFSVSTPLPAGILLRAGESASFTVTFSPSAPGRQSAVLRIQGADPLTEIYSFDLTGMSNPFGDNGGAPHIATLPDGRIEVKFKALPGVEYELQRSEDFFDWNAFRIVTAGPDGGIQFTDDPWFFHRMFYRLSTR